MESYTRQLSTDKICLSDLPFALLVSARIFIIRASDMTYGASMYTYIFNGIKRRAPIYRR